MSAYPPRLILWDVDHTLIRTGGIGRELYQAAFEQATGQPFRHRATISGRTELAILADTLTAHQIPSSDEICDAYARALAAGYRTRYDALRERGQALDGAMAVTRRLAQRGDVQSVVTGNLRDVTATKLAAFDLDGSMDLSVGGYAEDNEDRAELVRVALARVGARYSEPFTGRRVLIGDTPADVSAALSAVVPVIGVATGKFSVAELVDAGATATLPDLAEVDAVIAMIDRLAQS